MDHVAEQDVGQPGVAAEDAGSDLGAGSERLVPREEVIPDLRREPDGDLDDVLGLDGLGLGADPPDIAGVAVLGVGRGDEVGFERRANAVEAAKTIASRTGSDDPSSHRHAKDRPH